MYKFLSVCLIAGVVAMPYAASANDLSRDTSDPLFLQAAEEVLTKTSVAYWDNTLRVGQSFSYGMNSRLSIGANVHYQHHFNGDEDGFSAIDFGAVYRMGRPGDTESNLISDLLLGFKVGGSSHVRTPYYADST
ncbi:MAG: hypothetical protein IKB59_01710, partial [Alphaproteobacteria bacterium]|nr:hypothetical protein [Alphaproteobacteria bacterium]